MDRCPVCGGDVERGTPDETDYREETFARVQTEYEGKTYAFCSEEHREEFEANPETYT